jgi:HSP20 family molecular chaperone IbpA
MEVCQEEGVTMNALVPRLWSDVAEWFDLDLAQRTGLIRMEDHLSDTEYTIRAELPGLDPEKDVQITVNQGVLTIHAERKEEKLARHRTEFRYGVSQRSVRLPANADEDRVTARYGKGLLEITVPLTTTPAPKQIEIANVD